MQKRHIDTSTHLKKRYFKKCTKSCTLWHNGNASKVKVANLVPGIFERNRIH